jgi:hypothetical protein
VLIFQIVLINLGVKDTTYNDGSVAYYAAAWLLREHW